LEPDPFHRAATADTGAIDGGNSGCPFEQVPELEGGWRLITAPECGSGRPGAIGMGPVFRRRTYYLSKSRDERLPLPCRVASGYRAGTWRR